MKNVFKLICVECGGQATCNGPNGDLCNIHWAAWYNSFKKGDSNTMSFHLPIKNPCISCRLFPHLHDSKMCASCIDDAQFEQAWLTSEILQYEGIYGIPFKRIDEPTDEVFWECDISDLKTSEQPIHYIDATEDIKKTLNNSNIMDQLKDFKDEKCSG